MLYVLNVLTMQNYLSVYLSICQGLAILVYPCCVYQEVLTHKTSVFFVLYRSFAWVSSRRRWRCETFSYLWGCARKLGRRRRGRWGRWRRGRRLKNVSSGRRGSDCGGWWRRRLRGRRGWSVSATSRSRPCGRRRRGRPVKKWRSAMTASFHCLSAVTYWTVACMHWYQCTEISNKGHIQLCIEDSIPMKGSVPWMTISKVPMCPL